MDQQAEQQRELLRESTPRWSQHLDMIRQNQLLREPAFLRFARDRGAHVRGTTEGDPGRLHRIGWLNSDGVDHEGAPTFHPFRLYPLHRILNHASVRITSASPEERESLSDLLGHVGRMLPSVDGLADAAPRWNLAIELAVLLEPAYWDRVTGRITWNGRCGEAEARGLIDEHRGFSLEFVRLLDEEYWRKQHEALRTYAAQVDQNDGLYLLLRLAPWRRRERLKGPVSAALWVRHIAEVIRRAFEEAFDVQWAEEDRAFGQWYPGARERVYGSERPLDAPTAAKPHLAQEFGLFTGSVVRWYVEGETEYHAVKELLPGHHVGGIELINLKGNVAQEKGNIALKLSDHLREDRALRRLSIISFDRDVPANEKAIRRRIQADEIVGLVFGHDPDFEFANFSLSELVEIAARTDEDEGVAGDPVRRGDWSNVSCGKDFEERYCELSARRPRDLKGPAWGRALARYAAEAPEVIEDGRRRPIWDAVEAAFRSQLVKYEIQRDWFLVDPDTFELRKKEEEPPD